MNYYKILQLEPGASIREVKQAFRKFAHQFHPDKNPSNPEGVSHFVKLKEAYECLSNPVRKKQYDDAVFPKPKKRPGPVRHDLSFVKEKIRKKDQGKPLPKGTPKIRIEKNQCPLCGGYGFVYNKFEVAIRCAACFGSGRKSVLVK